MADLYIAISSSVTSPLQTSIDNFGSVLEQYTQNISENVRNRLLFSSKLSMPDNISEVFKALIFRTSTSIENYYIPLDYRGDGLQVRHIPIILKYIAEEDQKSRTRGAVRVVTIWGFEEPENGLELIKSFELADEFDDYSKDIQMFITSHSPAFYMKKNNQNTSVFCAFKNEHKERTNFAVEQNSRILGEHMGLMPLIAPFVSEKMNEIKQLKNELDENSLIDKNTILVEGQTDREYVLLAIRRYSEKLQELLDNGDLRIYSKPGRGGTKNSIRLAKSWIYCGYTKKLFVLFDKDTAGNKAKEELIGSEEFKNRSSSTSISVQCLQLNDEIKKIYDAKIILDFEIEHLFSKEMINELIKENRFVERPYDEIHDAFRAYASIDSPLIDVIDSICESKSLSVNFIKYNPKDEDKDKILKYVKAKVEKNSNDDCLDGLQRTIKKMENYFI